MPANSPCQPVDFWAVPKAAPRVQSRTFTDPDSGISLDLTFRSLRKDPLALAAAHAEAAELIALHIDGTEDAEPVPFIGPDGPVEDLSANLIRNLCVFRRMQPARERQEFMWWLGLAARAPELYPEIFAFAAELNGEPTGEDREGNSSGTPAASSCAASSGTTTNTPTSPSTAAGPTTRRRRG